MKIKAVLFGLLAFFSGLCLAQEEKGIDINGLFIGRQYTQEQIAEKFKGNFEPTAEKYDGCDNGWYYRNENGDSVYFCEGRILKFVIKSNDVSVLGGKLTVGESVSSIYGVDGAEITADGNIMRLKLNEGRGVVTLEQEGGQITGIACSVEALMVSEKKN